MEYWRSIRLYIWGIAKRIYWLLPTLVLDPFDIVNRLLKINYNPPQWSVWLLFVAGWLMASILTYHEVRLKTLSQKKTSWITKSQQKNHGRLPTLPEYLLPVANNYTSGEAISKKIELLTASVQFWNRLLPSQKDELMELVEWLGQEPRGYIARMESMAPPKPSSVRIKYQ